MASSGTFCLTLTVLCITAAIAQTSFVTVECNAQTLGEHGHQSLLECFVKTTKEGADAKILVVTWTKEGVEKPLLVFHQGDVDAQKGYRFAEPAWDENNRNTSLLITNTAVTDDGVYSCMVITDSGDDEAHTSLTVKATYKAPTVLHSIPEKKIPNQVGELVCITDGGYPKGQLRWFDQDGGEWTRSAAMNATKSGSGLFRLSSTFPLLQGSIFSKYTCMVFNASGGKEGSTTFEMPPPSPAELGGSGGLTLPSKVVAPVVVIGSLIVGLLLVLVYRRRSQNDHQRVPARQSDVEEGCLDDMMPETVQP
ncbi:CD276 antigen isoform X2 [Stegastes partitus]|uniref:CD276 antigen-like n=1 Tax=Stegastes partitus TaxID=144197 RepID=A0A3B5BE73_9TELE|nr:PREDICTED: CD276 antigen-like isoform X2 [Stegastes partitus]